MSAAARGDRRAFARLYEATAPKLLGVAVRICRDRNLAEDVVQDAYVKIWRSSGLYSAEAGRPMTWLIAITRNAAIDVMRKRPPPNASALDDDRSAVEAVRDPRDIEAVLVDADRLSRCLAEIPEERRRCFLQAYMEGLSREELAVRFERPVNTVKIWLHRTAGTLRACLERS